MDHRIGLLTRDGAPVYYAFADGYDAPPVEGALETVEAALGLRPVPGEDGRDGGIGSAAPAEDGAEDGADALARLHSRLRRYVARVHFPEGGHNEYEVFAPDKSKARTEVRRAFREEVPAPQYGHVAFEECRLEWIDEEDGRR